MQQERRELVVHRVDGRSRDPDEDLPPARNRLLPVLDEREALAAPVDNCFQDPLLGVLWSLIRSCAPANGRKSVQGLVFPPFRVPSIVLRPLSA